MKQKHPRSVPSHEFIDEGLKLREKNLEGFLRAIETYMGCPYCNSVAIYAKALIPRVTHSGRPSCWLTLSCYNCEQDDEMSIDPKMLARAVRLLDGQSWEST